MKIKLHLAPLTTNMLYFLFFPAIKIGRYTIEHKTSNIKEAKSIESQRKLQGNADSTCGLPTIVSYLAQENNELSLNPSSTTGSSLTGRYHIKLDLKL